MQDGLRHVRHPWQVNSMSVHIAILKHCPGFPGMIVACYHKACTCSTMMGPPHAASVGRGWISEDSQVGAVQWRLLVVSCTR